MDPPVSNEEKWRHISRGAPAWEDLLPSDDPEKEDVSISFYQRCFDEAKTRIFLVLMPQVGNHVKLLLDDCKFEGDMGGRNGLGYAGVVTNLLFNSPMKSLELMPRSGILRLMETLISEHTLGTNDATMFILQVKNFFPEQLYAYFARLTNLRRLTLRFVQGYPDFEEVPFCAALARNGSLQEVIIIPYRRRCTSRAPEKIYAYCTRNKVVPTMLIDALVTKKKANKRSDSNKKVTSPFLAPTLLVAVQQAPVLAPNRILKAFFAWNPPPSSPELFAGTKRKRGMPNPDRSFVLRKRP